MSGFLNPVIPGFFPDPSVCRVNDTYYLATSTFTYFPGVALFRSTNLAEWTQIGNVLDRSSQLDMTQTHGNASAGIYAPTIRYHAGRFWMITTVFNADVGRNFFVTADDPAGDWSDPVFIDIPGGIDPDIAWDGENCWVHFSRDQQIMRCRIDDRSGEVLEKPTLAWPGTGMQWPEAPHLIRHENQWYLSIAEGGTEAGHCVTVARSSSPTGPWESCPANPILTHRSLSHPIQNTGHADLVEATDGSWWMVLLGVRERGQVPGFRALGRETFLVPVEWVDGWPVVGDLELEMPKSPPGEPSGHGPVPGRDDFDAPVLGSEWISMRVPLGDAASLTERPGWLTLHGNGQGLDADTPVFAGRRQQHLWCRVRTLVDPGDSTEAGLAIRMDEKSHHEVYVADGEIRVRARAGFLTNVIATAKAPEGEVILRLETHEDKWGPDIIQLGFETDGEFHVLAALDGRFLTTQSAGGFIGRVMGVFAVEGTAYFDWFDHEAIGN